MIESSIVQGQAVNLKRAASPTSPITDITAILFLGDSLENAALQSSANAKAARRRLQLPRVLVEALISSANDKSERWRRPIESEIANGVRPPPFAQLAG